MAPSRRKIFLKEALRLDGFKDDKARGRPKSELRVIARVSLQKRSLFYYFTKLYIIVCLNAKM
jgi:hypothetical protein